MQPLMADEPSSNVREVPVFQHFAEKYKCCCSTVHVRQGAFIIGVLSVFLWLIDLSGGIVHSEHIFFVIFEYFEFIASIPSLILFFIGMKNYRSPFLLPFMAQTVIYLFMMLLGLCLSTYSVFDPSVTFGMSANEKNRKASLLVVRGENLLFMLSFTINIVVYSWFLNVVYKCYKYYKELETHRNKLDVSNH